ncbi:MAG TPA: ATPase, T2SS/T4P/T4SS family, partial [bacterium]|nr:ATPase, T2SS/T4P/T4SS family [bacterium]
MKNTSSIPADIPKLREGVALAVELSETLLKLIRAYAEKNDPLISLRVTYFLSGPYAEWLAQAQKAHNQSHAAEPEESFSRLQQAYLALLRFSRAIAELERLERKLEEETIVEINPLSSYLPDLTEPYKDLSNVLSHLEATLGDPALKSLLNMLDQMTARHDEWIGRMEKPEDFSADSDEDIYQGMIISFPNQLVKDAAARGAAGIHLTPGPWTVLVQYRLGEKLVPFFEIPLIFSKMLATRIKIITWLDIAERRHPQEGRVPEADMSKLGVPGLQVLTAATLPTLYGEQIHLKLVLRQDPFPVVPALAGKDLQRHQKLFKQRGGLILHAGPKESGRWTALSTDLRALMNHGLNVHALMTSRARESWPIPFTLLNSGMDALLTFKTLLRQDTDVVAVDEILNSSEGAEMALKAALSGKWILGLVYGRTAAGVLQRFMDMGLDTALLRAALKGICTHALLRKLCGHCRKAYVPPEEEWKILGQDVPKGKLFHSV